MPMEPGVDLLADYGVQTQSYYRGAKHLLGTIVEELLFDGTTGLVVIDERLVKRAIDRANGDGDADNEFVVFNGNNQGWVCVCWYGGLGRPPDGGIVPFTQKKARPLGSGPGQVCECGGLVR